MSRISVALAVLAATVAPAFLSAAPVLLPDGRSLAKIDFERHVQALLNRQGCNGGACHGSTQGRGGGLQLSLIAESPRRDYYGIAHGSRGRFINHAAPDESLILRKPTQQISHEGGARIAKNSWEFQVLREWIAAGAAWNPEAGKIARIEVTPRECFLLPEETQQLRVHVTFADGSREDMTTFCDFRVPHDENENKEMLPVSVTRLGEVRAHRPSAAWVLVIYRGVVTPVRVLSPWPAPASYPAVPEHNIIDRMIFAELRRMNIVPADLTSDTAFLRRVTIDATASLPTPEEIRQFIANPDPAKRHKKIDELLAHPRHAALWATRLIDMSSPSWGDRRDIEQVRWSQLAHDWFRKRIQDNAPFPEIVRGVLMGQSREGTDAATWVADMHAMDGAAYAERATLELPRRNLPDGAEGAADFAEHFASQFLGLDLHCARCHKHPLAAWTPADQRAFTSVFARVRVGNSPPVKTLLDMEIATLKASKQTPSIIQKDTARLLRLLKEVWLDDRPAFVLNDPETGVPLTARAPGSPIFDGDQDPRESLWHWMMASGNPCLARNIVNRVWAHYFGIGLIEPLGSFTDANPGHHPALLDALTDDFIAAGYDLRRLERTILQSRAYQLAHVKTASADDRDLFARSLPVRLPLRMFSDLMRDALDAEFDYPAGVPARLRSVETTAHDDFTGADDGSPWSLRSMPQRAELFRLFNRHEFVKACERDGGVASYLHILNSPPFQQAFRKSRHLQRLTKDPRAGEVVAAEIFLFVLSRGPTQAETEAVRKHLQNSPSRERFLEDVFWALLNSREFLLRQ